MPGDQPDGGERAALAFRPGDQQRFTTAYTNPFASYRIDALPFVPETEPIEPLLQKARRLRFRCMISGPHGSGKSTLLREVSRRLAEDGHRICRCRFKLVGPHWPKVRALLRRVDDQRIFVLDGADHLSPIQWGLIWWQSRRAGGLIVTSHQRRLLPLLTRRKTSIQLLRLLCDRLEVSAALPPGLLEELFVQHQGNIRDIFRHLYDIWTG